MNKILLVIMYSLKSTSKSSSQEIYDALSDLFYTLKNLSSVM